MKASPKFMSFTSHQGRVVYVFGVKYMYYNKYREGTMIYYRYKKVSNKKPNTKV